MENGCIVTFEPARDVNWHDGTVHVLGKFKKERDIPMQPGAQAALVEQIEAEDRFWKQHPQRLREVLAQGVERARIPCITPHALRHTFGTRWLQAGGDIYKLSKILGHSSVAVTEAHYAHLLKEDLVAASQQVKDPGRSATGRQCRQAQRGDASRRRARHHLDVRRPDWVALRPTANDNGRGERWTRCGNWRLPRRSAGLGALGLSLTVHFIWRWKTKGWTQPWGGWDDLEGANKD